MHAHHHHHIHELQNVNSALIFGIVINSLYVVVEFCYGMMTDSMGLLSDAGHNLMDVSALVLALIAFQLAKKIAQRKYTYGYKKSTILISLVNAITLFCAVVWIIFEGVRKLLNPTAIDGDVVAAIAAIGILVNGISAFFLAKDKEADLNIKSAYLHMWADTIVSVGVVVSGIVIHFTHWSIVDPIIALVIALLIAKSTLELLRGSLRLVIDGIPEKIDLDLVVRELLTVDRVKDVHHVHIWAISTTENAITAHIVVEELNSFFQIKKNIREKLLQFGITHSTLEVELESEECSLHC